MRILNGKAGQDPGRKRLQSAGGRLRTLTRITKRGTDEDDGLDLRRQDLCCRSSRPGRFCGGAGLEARGHQSILTRSHAELDLTRQLKTEYGLGKVQPMWWMAAMKVGGIHANATYPADFLAINTAIAPLNTLMRPIEMDVASSRFWARPAFT